jgi:hypothetical protein
MADKKDRIKLLTPPGRLEWPKLNAVNYGSEKFPVKNGNFETKTIIDKAHPEFAAFDAALQPLYEKAKEMALAKFAELPAATRKELKERNGPDGVRLRPLLTTMVDEKTEEVLDTVKLKATMGAGGISKKTGKPWMMRPDAFSATGKPIILFVNAPGTPYHGKPHPKAKPIYNGTKARLAIEIDHNLDGTMGYFVASDGTYGIRCSLQAVQILEYGVQQQRSASSYGFGTEEGYDGDEDEDTSWSPDDFASDTPTSEQGGTAGVVSGDF